MIVLVRASTTSTDLFVRSVQMIVPEAPQHLIADNTYDSDKLDAELRQYGVETAFTHKFNPTEGQPETTMKRAPVRISGQTAIPDA